MHIVWNRQQGICMRRHSCDGQVPSPLTRRGGSKNLCGGHAADAGLGAAAHRGLFSCKTDERARRPSARMLLHGNEHPPSWHGSWAPAGVCPRCHQTVAKYTGGLHLALPRVTCCASPATPAAAPLDPAHAVERGPRGGSPAAVHPTGAKPRQDEALAVRMTHDGECVW